MLGITGGLSMTSEPAARYCAGALATTYTTNKSPTAPSANATRVCRLKRRNMRLIAGGLPAACLSRLVVVAWSWASRVTGNVAHSPVQSGDDVAHRGCGKGP